MSIRNLIFIPLLAVFGCAEHIGEQSGPAIEVVPIEYQLSVKIEKNKQQKAWDYIDGYISENWNDFANQEFFFVWNTKEGKRFVNKYTEYLKSRGMESKQLSIHHDKTLNEAFDFSFSTTVHKVVTPICEHVEIGYYGEITNGCAPEGMRWKAITHPERMFDKSNF
ncbi:hypothetical protein [Vibrio pelagius]|uniref:hypothetical protein n=1 Tax=Vibrio pelagius TaxID=28169 RepID=UPI00354CAA36